MSTAQWYKVLLEKELNMAEGDNTTMEFIKSTVELASPDTDWEESLRKAVLKGLGPEVPGFLWKMLHKFLPTENSS